MSNDLALSHLFCDSHPSDATSILVRLPPEYVAGFFTSLTPAQGVNLLHHMPTAYATQLLSYLDTDFSARLLAAADFSTAARLLRPLSLDRRWPLLARMDVTQTAQLERILHYTPGSVGNLVEIPLLTALGDWSVKYTQRELKKISARNLNDIPVVDDVHRFLGTVTLHDLLTSRDNRRLDEICHGREMAFPAYTTVAAIFNHPNWEKSLTLPVVDRGGILLGVVHRTAVNDYIPGSATDRAHEVYAPVLALAELYWATSASFLSVISNALNPKRAKP